MPRTVQQELANHKTTSTRFMVIALVLFTWLLVIVGRLAWVQIVRHADLAERAERNHGKELVVRAPRGQIVDRNGKTLALSLLSDSVSADLVRWRRASDEKRKKIAHAIAPLLGMNVAEFTRVLNAERGGVLWLKRKVTPELAGRLRAVCQQEHITEIALERESQRYYPNETLAAHLIGQVDANEKGVAGLEKKWQEKLLGQAGKVELASDALGNAFERFDTPAIAGASIVTTIDAVLQHKVEILLDETVRQTGAKSATAIVLEPQTGEVLAIANAPTFNPNERLKVWNEQINYIRTNHALADIFEPGSVFKLVAYAGGLEEGVIQPETLIDCQGGLIRVAGRPTPVRDSHLGLHTVTAEEAFAKSSNVGAIKVAQQLGRERLLDYVRRFGFLKPTGIELPGEVRGTILSEQQWQYGAMGVVPIGQGVTVTALQSVAAFAAIANGGLWLQPHVVREIVAADKRKLFTATPRSQRVVSEKTALQLATMMKHVVASGTGRAAGKLAGYSAAGKTGTAQKAVPGRGYADNKFVASFVGFVPATQPRFAIAVMLDEPKGAHQGGQVSAPLFNLIAQAALSDYAVPPDDATFREALAQLANEAKAQATPEIAPPTVASVAVPLPSATPRQAKAETNVAVRQPAPTPLAKGTGVTVSSTLPAVPQLQAKTGKAPNARVLPSAPQITMPDLTGRSLRSVTQTVAQLQLRMKLIGSGKAYKQTPAAGARVKPGDQCQIEFH